MLDLNPIARPRGEVADGPRESGAAGGLPGAPISRAGPGRRCCLRRPRAALLLGVLRGSHRGKGSSVHRPVLTRSPDRESFVGTRAASRVAVALHDLPKYLVLDPSSTVRIDMHLEEPSCEIDVALDNPRPGRSFVLLIGHRGGPFVQRVRLAGRAKVYFDPASPGDYVLAFTNPDTAPVVLRLRARAVIKAAVRARRGPRRASARTSRGRDPRPSARAVGPRPPVSRAPRRKAPPRRRPVPSPRPSRRILRDPEA